MSHKLSGQISNLAELRNCLKSVSQVGNGLIMARCVHLVQSSGYGKTKLCLELINDCRRGLYFVKRDPNSTGFPPEPLWVREFLKLLAEAGDFHFYNHISFNEFSFLSPAQNSQVGVMTRLFTSNPVVNPGYLAYADESYRERNPEEWKLIQKYESEAGLQPLEVPKVSEMPVPDVGVVDEDVVMQD